MAQLIITFNTNEYDHRAAKNEHNNLTVAKHSGVALEDFDHLS